MIGAIWRKPCSYGDCCCRKSMESPSVIGRVKICNAGGESFRRAHWKELELESLTVLFATFVKPISNTHRHAECW
jgi:hypothetical protein